YFLILPFLIWCFTCFDLVSILPLIKLRLLVIIFLLFFFSDMLATVIFTLSLHDALPISMPGTVIKTLCSPGDKVEKGDYLLITRSEEHTSELQSRFDLVCRLLLEKKNS